MSFTTGEEATVPNMGFEDWHQDGKVICPWQEGDNRWWDTGNWGSTTLSEKDNITLSTEDIRTGSTGKFAAILKSQKIVVKFAAGNLFIGEYKKTVGTNGILGFGRSFTSCPTRLKVTLNIRLL